jgi:hypothetical protein
MYSALAKTVIEVCMVKIIIIYWEYIGGENPYGTLIEEKTKRKKHRWRPWLRRHTHFNGSLCKDAIQVLKRQVTLQKN